MESHNPAMFQSPPTSWYPQRDTDILGKSLDLENPWEKGVDSESLNNLSSFQRQRRMETYHHGALGFSGHQPIPFSFILCISLLPDSKYTNQLEF